MSSTATEHVERRRPLSLSQTVEMLIGAVSKSSGEHSTVKLTRNARGHVQVEVSVRTGEGEIETVEQAREKAQQVFAALCELYPMAAES